MKYSILVVDDDPHIREVLRYALEKENLQVLEAADGVDGLRQALALQPSVIVLDIMMPEMNGLDVCQKLRQTSRIPILFLSSRDDEIDKILGLELGGDDYMSKPFSPRELIARIKVMLRRLEFLAGSAEAKIHAHGNLSLNMQTLEIAYQGKTLNLTSTEFNLLHTLLNTPQKVYSRDELIQLDVFKDIVSERTVDSHIRRLRHKFAGIGCETVIETVHGFGYRLGSCQ